MVMRSGSPATGRGGFAVTERALGIIGSIAAFLGAFILLGSGNQSIGLGGQVSWQVDQIAPWWGYSLLILGAVLVAGAVALKLLRPKSQPRSGKGDVLAHSAIFVVVNAFLWAQDIAIGGGLDYAYWITIPWGIGLVVHARAQTTANREPAGPQ